MIPAAGLGKRMKSHGPKSLIPIKYGQRILDRQVSLIDDHFKDYNLVIICGFEADKLIDESPTNAIKVENELYENTNVARSIGLGLRAIPSSDRLLLINGDLVFTNNMIGSMSYDYSCLLVSDKFMGDGEVGCIINKKGYLENLMYDLPVKWCQIAYFQGKELEELRNIACQRKNKKLFAFEIINKIIDKGGSFKCIDDPSVKVIDVDTSKDIKRAKEII
jgi:choline kinase